MKLSSQALNVVIRVVLLLSTVINILAIAFIMLAIIVIIFCLLSRLVPIRTYEAPLTTLKPVSKAS